MAEIDHLVYVVPDLEAAIDRVEVELGVRPAMGGRHVGMGTWNALLALCSSDAPPSYLEVIAADPAQPDPGGPRPFGIDEDPGPRLATFAARPSTGETLDELVARLRDLGHDPGDPVPMSRTTPDGDVLAWRLTMPSGAGGGLVPFLIEWGDTPMPATTIDVEAELTSFAGGTPAPEVVSVLDALELAGLDRSREEPGRLTALLSADGRTMRL